MKYLFLSLVLFLQITPLKAQFSFLQIESDPGIEVYLDGTYSGKTDTHDGILNLEYLQEGRHQLEFKIYDYVYIDSLYLRDSTLHFIEVFIVSKTMHIDSTLQQKLHKSFNNNNDLESDFGVLKDTRDNREYKTIRIGEQTWMAENLNFNYGIGNYYYANDKAQNIFGRLYDWDVALIACPSGWRLPSDTDWGELETFLQMNEEHIISRGWRNIGNELSLKSGHRWKEDRTAGNTTGFSALPAGCRDKDGWFYTIGEYAYFWTSTEVDKEDAVYRTLTKDKDYIGRFRYNKKYAFSVRCIKNTDHE